MNPYPGCNSVLIMDNARIHHGDMITEICREYGVLVIYLPAYSPDLNPIEKGFSAMKRRLQRDQGWSKAQDKGQYLLRIAGRVLTRSLMRPLYESSGYATSHYWTNLDTSD